MSRMSDIMEMVKQGYSVKEIKEVFELGKEIESEPAEENAETAQEENTERRKSDPDPVQDPAADPPTEDPQPDLKYQELENKYNDLLKKYQQNNVRQDISGNNEEKTVEEAARDVLAAMIGG